MKATLLTVSSDQSRTATLVRSLQKFNWTYHIIEAKWHGYGTKLLATFQYILEHPEITHFFFADAYDVVALGTMSEALSKVKHDVITFSAEKNCWPDSELTKYYEPTKHGEFNYLNSGLYFAPREAFLELFDADMPEYLSDDQLWATKQYLFNDTADIALDRKCEVFQSYSFIGEDDYSYEGGRLVNNITDTLPVLIHGNGTTNMDKIIEML